MRQLKCKNREAGTAIIEYVVVSFFLMAAIMWTPVPRSIGGDGRSTAGEMLIDAIKENYRAYAWAMSVPI
ncbi:hypothetical protein GCM10007877_00880 [Marinibactrum halimedae]|uniref:Uncharacterized protein n=1 Tax=Marinibactrum halimedae TaxID=1444977 RepID=A0AA37T391_9GAMM|nr:hypothetical protein GCM10007877_00880 [Marinibactrum halimedae]